MAFLSATCGLAAETSPPKIRLASIFTDSMVLQRDRPVPVWGWAPPGTPITVACNGVVTTGVAGWDERWLASLPPQPAGGPHELTVGDGTTTRTLRDVLVGDVWLASGQSNMNWQMSRSAEGAMEIPAASHPRLRLFTIYPTARHFLDKDVNTTGPWAACSPETVAEFSAVAYHFGRVISETQNVPVGLIHASLGSTSAELWTGRQALLDLEAFRPHVIQTERDLAYPEEARARHAEQLKRYRLVQEKTTETVQEPHHPLWPWVLGSLRDGMIAPAAPFALRGFLWYQGEGNSARAYEYRELLPTLIRDWRRLWNSPELPFLIVQLPNYLHDPPEPAESALAELREAQLLTLKIPHTGLAVTIDVGDPDDIHPGRKRPVGERLARVARAQVYGEKILPGGPRLRSFRREGASFILEFDDVGEGLRSRGKGQPRGFALAGSDRKFVWAEARITGKETVTVSAPDVPAPEAVRYAWGNSPPCDLINSEDLPASPFRTDTWPGLTKDNRYEGK